MSPRVWLLFAALAAPSVLAQSGQLVPTSTGEPDPKVLSLREMTIDVGLARGFARVNIRQVFENHTDAIQEGTYRFALPPSAAVGDFAVWDGTVRIPGVILEKARARAIYRSLTTQRIDPGLLQQGEEDDAGGAGARPSGGALFSVTVAPIPARATKRLELQFQQDVPFVAGQGEFRLALKPASGETPVVGSLEIHVRSEDASVSSPADAVALTAAGSEAAFSGRAVPLDRDLVVTLRSTSADPLRLAAFRNPDGALPDGLALAPWERPSEIPPEKDGFFLLEATPPARATAAPGAPDASRKPVSLAILFDTSLSHRWLGLEAAYARLVSVLQALTPADRFVLIPFDRQPAAGGAPTSASPASIEAALTTLRARPLGVGTDVVAAVTAGRQKIGDAGRILLLTDGAGSGTAKALAAARGALPLFTSVGGGEAGEALRAASAQVLGAASTSLESDLFVERLLAPALSRAEAPRAASGPPFSVAGGEPKIRDVYPVLLQPLAPGALSGWVGRYALPAAHLEWTFASSLFPGGRASLTAPLPERALEARDLPRRWARARVDYLLALIEAEGERREWIDEVIALSKRYKFVTPYTAFLAAPRSLLRPRRIQPGDPVLRVDCDPGIVSATALFPFGLRLPLVRRPGTALWEGRFLVPEGLADGRYDVRIVLRDASGTRLTETKNFVLDGRAPTIRPEAIPDARPGASLRVAVRTDADVILLSARLGLGAPIPLRWDAAAKRSVGTLQVPATLPAGRQEVVFEAVDGANNHGFATASLELRP